MNTWFSRFMIAAALVCVISVGASAGGTSESSSSGPEKVTFWNGYTGPDRPTVEAIVQKFNAKDANIQIDMQISPWDSLFQKLMPAFIAGNGPDLVGFSVTSVPQYATAGRLQPLDSYLSKSKSLSKDVLVPGLVSGATIDGKLYGVPMAFASMVMYFNKDEFAKAGLDPNNPPKTLDELAAAWKKLVVKDANGNVTQYAQAIGVHDTVPMVPVFFWDYGADFVTADGKGALNSPKALSALQFLQKAFVQDNVSPVGLSGQEADNLFAAGKAAIEWNGPWALTGFQSAGINVGVAEVPAGPAGRFTWGGDTVMVMNKDSHAKDGAWSFMEYWNSKDSQQFWAQKQAFPPTRTDMANDPALASNPFLKYFISSASYAKIFLAGQTKYAQIDQAVLVPMYESVFSGKMQAQAALDKANQDLNKLLQK